jgi:5'-3' exonuclease
MSLKTITLCIDAQYLLKQSFHGAKDLYMGDDHIGALYQFLTTIRKLIPIVNPDRVILFWDGQHSGKLRYEIFDQYKSNRIGKSWYSNPLQLTDNEIKKELEKDKSILKQRIRIKQYAEELFFRQIEDDVTEADDCIAYYVQNLQENEEAVIYTNDRDLCQLINNDVSMYLANKKTIVTPNNYFIFFNHHISNMILVKSIEGDPSDNIDGIKGVKEKTLIKLFPEIKKKTITFDKILDKTKLIQEERIKDKKKPLKSLDNILNSKDKYYRNKKLVDLSKPLMTEEAIEMVDDIRTLPLDDEDRGSKNLLRMMVEDGFINVIWNQDYVDYLTPFIPIAKNEKEYFRKYEG